MTLAEGILWFLSTFLACWGLSLIYRSRQDLRIEKEQSHKPAEHRQTGLRDPMPGKRVMGLGVLAIGLGIGAGFGGFETRQMMTETHSDGLAFLTPWRLGAGGIIGFGAVSLGVWWRGDPSRGRLRCPGCWQSLEGVPTETDKTTCPECGRVTLRAKDRHRPQRFRAPLAFGVVLVMLGGSLLYVCRETGSFRPASLLPARALVHLYIKAEDPPPASWLRNELRIRSVEYGGGMIAEKLMRRMVERARAGQPLFISNIGTTQIHNGIEDIDSVRRVISVEDFELLWAAATAEFAELHLDPDPKVQKLAAGMYPTFGFLFDDLMSLHEDVPEEILARDNPSPSMVFTVPDFEPATAKEITRRFAASDYSWATLMLVNSRLTEERAEALVASMQSPVFTMPYEHPLLPFLPDWSVRWPSIDQEIRSMLMHSFNGQKREFAAKVVLARVRDGSVTLDNEMVELLMAQLTLHPNYSYNMMPPIHPSTFARTLAIRALLESDVPAEVYAPLILKNALQTDMHASQPDTYVDAVFDLFDKGEGLVTLEYLERMARSSDQDVRLEFIVHWRRAKNIDVEGVEKLVEGLVDSPDPRVAAWAKASLNGEDPRTVWYPYD